MKSLLSWLSGVAMLVLLSGTAVGADAIAAGKVKSINSAKKEFVLSDASNKDWTIKFGSDVVVNRDGKESKTDLNVDDQVNVCHDNGFVTWTAKYILVKEGASKKYDLMRGTVKSYHEGKKELTVTDAGGKDYTFTVGSAKVRLNTEASKAEDLKVGDTYLAIVETAEGTPTLKSLMAYRK